MDGINIGFFAKRNAKKEKETVTLFSILVIQ